MGGNTSKLSNMSTLRRYQSEAIDRLRAAYRAGRRALLLVAPTGAGKTVMFAHMTASAVARGLRVLILVHRQELIDQVARAVATLPHGIIAAGSVSDLKAPVQVASVQTLARRLKQITWAPDLIVIDEAHHAAAQTWKTVLDAFPLAWRLGVTATPERLDGKGLGDMFEELIIGPTVAELQDLGFLCQTKYYVPKTIDRRALRTTAGEFRAADCEEQGRKIMGDVVSAYNRFATGMRAVAFCASIRHAEAQAEAFGSGWEVITSKLNAPERRRMVERFTTGETIGLTSVDVISEGFDLPAIQAAILLRPTQSLGMHLQQLGRALRPFPGKPHAVIIDHVNNLLVHGLAEEDRDWSLEGNAAQRSMTKLQPTKRCPECFVLMPPGCSSCPECNHEFEAGNGRKVETGEAEIVELTDREQKAARIRAFFQSLGRKANSALQSRNMNPPLLLREWEDVAADCGYQEGWAWHVFQKQKSSLRF